MQNTLESYFATAIVQTVLVIAQKTGQLATANDEQTETLLNQISALQWSLNALTVSMNNLSAYADFEQGVKTCNHSIIVSNLESIHAEPS